MIIRKINVNRLEFVKDYMTNSEMTPYKVDGDKVIFECEDNIVFVNYALPCNCGEEGCQGWAMISEGSQNWHKFQNNLTGMTFSEAMSADLKILQELRNKRESNTLLITEKPKHDRSEIHETRI